MFLSNLYSYNKANLCSALQISKGYKITTGKNITDSLTQNLRLFIKPY